MNLKSFVNSPLKMGPMVCPETRCVTHKSADLVYFAAEARNPADSDNFTQKQGRYFMWQLSLVTSRWLPRLTKIAHAMNVFRGFRVFWWVTMQCWVGGSRNFEGKYRLHIIRLKTRSFEMTVTTSSNAESHPRRPESSITQEPAITFSSDMTRACESFPATYLNTVSKNLTLTAQ